MRKHIGMLFVLFTYILTWAVEIPLALTKHGYASIHISKSLQTICTLSPGIIALILTGVLSKWAGLKTLFREVVKWRVKFKWYIIIIILSIVLCGLSLFLFNSIFGQINKPEPAYNFLFYFILILPLSALWEELGWRGFLLPILQEKYSPLKASMIIGFVWGLWHLPIYLAIDPYGDKTIIFFFIMFIGCFALSTITTWLYNSTRGSLFICILFHNAVNTSAAYFYGNLKGHEFRPFIFWVILLGVSAILICFKTKGALNNSGQFKISKLTADEYR